MSLVLSLALVAFSIGLLVVVLVAAVTGLRCRRALNAFKKASRGLPLAGNSHWLVNHTFYPIKKNVNQEARKLHRELGNTFGWLYRYQYCASTVDLDIIKLLNQDEAQQHTYKLKRDIPIKEWMQSIASIGGDEWRRVRRVIAPALKSKHIRTADIEGEIRTAIDLLVGHIDRKLDQVEQTQRCEQRAAPGEKKAASVSNRGTVRNMGDILHRYSMDLVLRCIYGQYDTIDYEKPSCFWTDATSSSFKGMQGSKIFKLALAFPGLMPVIGWAMWYFHPMGHWRRSIVRYSIEATRKSVERLNAQQKKDARELALNGHAAPLKRTLLDAIVAEFFKSSLTREQYLASVCFLLPAADKTSADSLTHTMYLLAAHKSIQDKLRLAIMQDGGSQCQYLGWVLNESLRLYPTASSGCGRVTSRDIETKEGYVLPRGTFISTHAFVIHRLPEYWGQDADEFRPERWADTSGHHPFQFMPFGGGIRACPGREFAMFQMREALTKLLLRYSLSCEPKDDIYDFDAPFWQTTIAYSPVDITFERLTGAPFHCS